MDVLESELFVHLVATIFNKGFYFAPNWLKVTCNTVGQSTVMGHSYSISIEGLKHVAPK